MMKVLVIGANGKIGSILSEKLSQSNKFEPLAMIRKEEQKAKFEAMNVPTIMGDLTGSVEDLKENLNGVDAVVFTAGSGGKTGDDKTLEIDLDGAVKSMLAAEQAEKKRFIMVSAAGADVREFWSKSGINPYYVAKHFADKTLKESALEYTIFRPVRLTDDSGKGTIKVSNSPEGLSEEISREDVADCIIESLTNDHTIRKVYEISEGSTSIKNAL